MKVKTELHISKCLSFGIDFIADKRLLKEKEKFILGFAFACFVVFFIFKK